MKNMVKDWSKWSVVGYLRGMALRSVTDANQLGQSFDSFGGTYCITRNTQEMQRKQHTSIRMYMYTHSTCCTQ